MKFLAKSVIANSAGSSTTIVTTITTDATTTADTTATDTTEDQTSIIQILDKREEIKKYNSK